MEINGWSGVRKLPSSDSGGSTDYHDREMSLAMVRSENDGQADGIVKQQTVAKSAAQS
jgi:hypothetical protein